VGRGLFPMSIKSALRKGETCFGTEKKGRARGSGQIEERCKRRDVNAEAKQGKGKTKRPGRERRKVAKKTDPGGEKNRGEIMVQTSRSAAA